jgi:glucose/arabinose dehydrogenase
MKQIAATLALATLVVALACDEDDPQEPSNPVNPPPKDYTYELVPAFDVTFTNAVDIANAGDSRLFIVEQSGTIRVLDTANPTAASVFLTIPAVVSGGELGLLGLAFAPDYATSGHFYVYYTVGTTNQTRRSRVTRFTVSADPNVADSGSEALLLEIGQRAPNHNGGDLAFDGAGHLLVAVGDEGSFGDFFENAQDLTTLQGSILRLDVSANATQPPYYQIPADNPFAGNMDGYREEIFAYGLRNPWRISYDPASGRIWAGDVGQDQWEEVDIITSGGNFGWDCREGMHAFAGPGTPSPLCADATNLIDPVWEYAHGGGNQSITGGYVYRGPTATSLAGKYIYADYGSGRVWALTYDGTTATDNFLVDDAAFALSTFGTGSDGELYAMQYSATGRIHRIQQTEVTE